MTAQKYPFNNSGLFLLEVLHKKSDISTIYETEPMLEMLTSTRIEAEY
jgi:hypothetical protein